MLAACGGSDETTNATPEVTAELRQSRLDQSIGNVSVSIANNGDTPVHVNDVILHAPPFPDAASDNDGVILPGQRVDFRVAYDEPACAGATPTLGSVVAAAQVDGSTVEIAVADSQDALSRLLITRCGAQRLAEVVDVRFGSTWTLTPDSSAVLGTIEISRVGADPRSSSTRSAGVSSTDSNPSAPTSRLPRSPSTRRPSRYRFA